MPNVKIYTTPPCVYCKMAKAFFQENSIKYEEVDVAGDAKARQEMITKSGQIGVPVIDVGGKIVIGFDKGRLSELLNIK
ncbi:MAG: glutathione S-transferase N-terminal domain-containing protein [Candidatus Sungbacteria bacterium]|uniref:Glutathione S-transferase N-terminal domain-containing protein n=1 Tax=Candidatus Sungiibacteriota bacterium TaxID=2750080 RepID=A0A931WNV7_9BACT|nr:glutathione S-transferase N-terminal domain-containing protein [Candidatus Sungbacteria bacterium]